MLIRILTPGGELATAAPVRLVPDPLVGGPPVTARAEAGGLVRVSAPPRVFRVEAADAAGSPLVSRPIARPPAYAATELVVRLHPLTDG